MKTTEIEDHSSGEWESLTKDFGALKAAMKPERPPVPEAADEPMVPGSSLSQAFSQTTPLQNAAINALRASLDGEPVRPAEAAAAEAAPSREPQPVSSPGKQALLKPDRQGFLEPDKQGLLEQGWAKLPESYPIPAVAPTLDEARAWCKNLAETHYENFHVATWFLPKALRPHFHAIYAYCRVSDDLGDEVGDTAVALALLDQWGEELDDCYAGKTRHPVFVALAETIRECSIPKEPFADLLAAFRQDQTVTRYATMEDVLGYCRYSANPVGRLVLYACGEADIDRDERFRLSDATCTALQLANFWQDVREDWARGRVYLPQNDMAFFHVTETTLDEGIATEPFRGLLRTEVEYARGLFEAGLPLIGMVSRELAVDLDLFSRGGLEILRAIEHRDYDVLSARPAIRKSTKAGLALRAVSAKLLPFLSLHSRRSRPVDGTAD